MEFPEEAAQGMDRDRQHMLHSYQKTLHPLAAVLERRGLLVTRQMGRNGQNRSAGGARRLWSGGLLLRDDAAMDQAKRPAGIAWS